jgi:membrane-associated phospholipid phosphatase
MSILSRDDVRTTTERSTGRRGGHDTPLLESRSDGLADRLDDRWRDHSPITATSVVAITGLIIMAVVMVGLGLLLVHVLAPGGLGRWDATVNEWFVTRRTTTLNTVTRWGSDLGGTLTIVGIAFVAAVALAIARRWDAVRFVVISLVIEVSVFLISTVFVNRPRPDVPRLDVSPPTSSYPSGHTAATIVLYVALALIVSTLTRSAFLRTAVWILAIALPIVVGLSRLYRGMHHPTDELASLLLAIGALLLGLLAVRTGSAVAEHRHRRSDTAHAR